MTVPDPFFDFTVAKIEAQIKQPDGRSAPWCVK